MTEYDYSDATFLSVGSHPAQSSSKQFCCPNPRCTKRYKNQAAVNYHAKFETCKYAERPVFPPLRKLYTTSKDATSPATDSKGNDFGLRSKLLKLLKEPKHSRKGRHQSPAKSPARITDKHGDIERGRSRVQKHLAASAPNLHISHRSISPQLHKFPPPPPLHSKKHESDGHQQQRDIDGQERRRQRQLKREEKERIRQDLWARRMEEENSEGEWATSGFNILHSKPLLANRLSERNYILPRFNSHSRCSSAHDVPEASSNTKRKDHSFSLPDRKVSFKTIPPTIVTQPCLSKPLPLPHTMKKLRERRAAREREWGSVSPVIRQSGRIQPCSPQRGYFYLLPRRRRSSPHPSSGRSSRSSYSRSSSRSSFSVLPSIPDPQDSPPPSPRSSRASSLSRSPSHSRSNSHLSLNLRSPFSRLAFVTSADNPEDQPPSEPAKIRIHFNEHTFILVVSQTIKYSPLLERLENKLRQRGCNIGSILMHYKDFQGDFITLQTTEEVQLMFKEHQPLPKYIDLLVTPT